MEFWKQETRKSYHQRRGWLVQYCRVSIGFFFQSDPQGTTKSCFSPKRNASKNWAATSGAVGCSSQQKRTGAAIPA